MNIPENLKYTKDHEWVKFDGDISTIGITSLLKVNLEISYLCEVDTEGELLDAKRFLER